MAYKINNTFGTLLVTLADGTIDVATTDLTLIGKGYAGFGEKLNENLVKLLENFSNTSAPSNKIQGQLWFDQTNKRLNVYDGTKFKPAGGPTNSTSQPTNAVLGDTWFDTANTQLYVYNGTTWTLIGPTTVAGSGVTQVVSEIASDDTGVNQSYLKLVANDAVVGVVSNVAFTPSSTEANATALIGAGFSSVAQGIQLSTAVASAKFRGTATDSDALGGVAAANYLRSDANDSTNSSFSILNDTGLILGGGSDITMSLSGDNLTIANTTQNKDIIFTVNDAGTTVTMMTMDGSTGLLELPTVGDLRVKGNLTVDGTHTTFNTTTLSVEDNIIELNRNISNNAGMPNFTGLKVNRGETSSATEQDLYWVWDETFADDGTTIHGNAGGAFTAYKHAADSLPTNADLVDIRCNVIHALATSAQYADVAERFEADAPMTAGAVVMVGGDAEITETTSDLSDQVFGVISDQPAYAMNAGAGNNDSHPFVAMTGRTPVRVVGAVTKGQRLVSSSTKGCARAVATGESFSPFNVIGRALESSTDAGIKLVNCAVRTNN